MESFRAVILSLSLLGQLYGGFGQFYGGFDQYAPMTRPSDPRSHISCKENARYYNCLFKNVHIDEDDRVSLERFADYGRPHVADVQSLAFAESTVRRLPKELLLTYPHSALLNLQNVQLRTIDRDAFMYGGQVKQLYMGFNSLSQLDRGVFDRLVSLEVISLNVNGLTLLPAHLFSQNPMLFSVSITNNHLTGIEDSTFAHNPRLESVNVSSNSIEHFDLSRLTEAHEIDVSYNRLTEVKIPSRLGRLFASRNYINHIVPNGENRELKQLYLSNNKLTTISWASVYPELEELDLGHNEIEDVSNRHLPTRKLQKLLLNNNRLFSFDLTKTVPKRLRILDLSYNQLTYVVNNSKVFDRLEQLYLHHNDIVTLKFSDNNTLQNVSLSNNDWDCGNLRTQLAVLGPTSIQDYDVPPCKTGYIMESQLCCKEALMPYHDRLLEQIRANSVYELAKRIQCDNEPNAIIDIDELNKVLQNVSSVSPELLEDEVDELNTVVAALTAAKNTQHQELYSVKQILSNKLPRYGGTHEGFDTPRILADKLISRLEDRRRFRESKTVEEREGARVKKSERDGLQEAVDAMETILRNKKALNNKMKQDTAGINTEIRKLKAQLNANAPSSRIYA
uniref:Putative membrane glycoprotein lig-1 n=1 Tax=Anopheles triannulatus TaxID=58253 RepID=A0A2M4AP29_9DIPT